MVGTVAEFAQTLTQVVGGLGVVLHQQEFQWDGLPKLTGAGQAPLCRTHLLPNFKGAVTPAVSTRQRPGGFASDGHRQVHRFAVTQHLNRYAAAGFGFGDQAGKIAWLIDGLAGKAAHDIALPQS